MIDKKLIDKITKKLVAAYNPIEIYLFGSYAWGTPDRDSDIDLLIIVEKSDEKSYKRPIAAYDALLDINIPNDVLVYTREEFEAMANNITTLCYQIKKRGKRIYAKA